MRKIDDIGKSNFQATLTLDSQISYIIVQYLTGG